MLFSRCLVMYNDFGHCYDKITVAGVDFISRRSIYDHYLQEGMFLGTTRKNISSSMLHRENQAYMTNL